MIPGALVVWIGGRVGGPVVRLSTEFEGLDDVLTRPPASGASRASVEVEQPVHDRVVEYRLGSVFAKDVLEV